MREFHKDTVMNKTYKPRGIKMKVLDDMPGDWEWGDVDYFKAVS